MAATVNLRSSLELARIRDLYEHDRRWQEIGVVLVVVPSVLGYFLSGWLGVLVGLLFGLVGLWAGTPRDVEGPRDRPLRPERPTGSVTADSTVSDRARLPHACA